LPPTTSAGTTTSAYTTTSAATSINATSELAHDAGFDEEQSGTAVATHLEANERSSIQKSNMDGTFSLVSLSKKGGCLLVSPPRIQRRISSMIDVVDCAEPSRSNLDGHATELKYKRQDGDDKSQTLSPSKDSRDSHVSTEEKYERQYGDDKERHRDKVVLI
jgi:hypothetical protein